MRVMCYVAHPSIDPCHPSMQIHADGTEARQIKSTLYSKGAIALLICEIPGLLFNSARGSFQTLSDSDAAL